MRSDNDVYVHRPVHGLPKSLTQIDGKTVAVIGLMQKKAGLNRERRRQMQARADDSLDIPGDFKKLVSKNDWIVLACYMSANERFGSFWHVARRMQRGQGAISKVAYATAVDVQLLSVYEPDWILLSLDTDVMTAECVEWDAIAQAIRRVSSDNAGDPPLGAFMLWPRLKADLAVWVELPEESRRNVAHAVFALSSIGWTTWFIEAAVTLCPALADYLDPVAPVELTRREGECTHAAEGDSTISDPVSLTEAGDDKRAAAEAWGAMTGRLEALAQELKDRPNREAIEELGALFSEFRACGAALPSREDARPDRLLALRKTLSAELAVAANRPGFEWIDGALIEQIDARWALAGQTSDNGEVDGLIADAEVVCGRVLEASTPYAQALRHFEACRDESAATAAALFAATTLGAQRTAQLKNAEAQRDEAMALEQMLECQDALINASSPFAARFDYALDYVAQVGERSAVATRPVNLASGLAASADAVLDEPAGPASEVAADARHNEVSEILAQAPVEGNGAEDVGNESVARSFPPVAADVVHETTPFGLNDASIDALDEVSAASRAMYTDEAGEICRPMWRMLSLGQPALAYHAAEWIEFAQPDVRIPPPDLLAAVAFASELALPDGALQSALSIRLGRIAPDDYTVDAPRSWHIALNLLLVAATLRPMVLAPATSATSVAGYLHLDADYPALYALVQKLRGVSAKLVGFPIEPSAFRKARGEVATREELRDLQSNAADWLRVQAPAYTIRFGQATNVWKQWIRPGGEVENLIMAVVQNRIEEAERVRTELRRMADPQYVARLVDHTDRKVLGRRRGDDIHASAFEHLSRLLADALTYAHEWLGLVDLLGSKGDRLRELLEEVHSALLDSHAAVDHEITREPEHDPWGLIVGSQQQVVLALKGLLGLFDSGTAREAEASSSEVLGRSLLLLPRLAVDEAWAIDVSPDVALNQLGEARFDAVGMETTLRERLERGDILGAEMMVEAGLVPAASAQLRPDRERWKKNLRAEISECRRSVEIGTAYGYLPDVERAEIETQLARWEAQLEDLRRFDVVRGLVVGMRARVAAALDARKRDVRAALSEIAVFGGLEAATVDVEKALEQGDITTANELVHWLQLGKPASTDLDEPATEGFDDFFGTSMPAIETWLVENKRETIELALRQGTAIAGLDSRRVDGAQRIQAARMFEVWADMKVQREGERSRLVTLFSGLGFEVQGVSRADRVSERVADREVWTLDAKPVEDRSRCVLPAFGSVAAGRYRIICVWGRPTEEDLLQWVGDASVNSATLLLYFGRMSERKWRDLGRVAKTKRRSFVLLDETLLVYLCGVAGSRMRPWFDVATPFSHVLPYDPTAGLVPPEMFYGRGEELELVRSRTGGCFIYGGRQLGKTALLKRAEQSFHHPDAGQFAKWVDLRAEGIGVSVVVGEIWVSLYDRFKDLEARDTKSTGSRIRKSIADRVVAIIREFLEGNPDRRVLLLLDEADRFFEQDGKKDFVETRRLKQLMDDTKRRFKVVFAGLHNVLRMTEWPNHPLAHFGTPIEIGPLRDGPEFREAADLIRKPMAAAGFAFESKSLVIRILAQTNYYPSLIQLYCSHLLRHLLSVVTAPGKGRDGPRYLITDKDIEHVYSSDALRDEIRGKFRLTLQLDPRYEVLAYAMALALLRGQYLQTEGMPWQTIRQAGALHWWAEGFHDTRELDFQVLLDEMVGLGVLSKRPAGCYALRNPNILLLLGSQEEIGTVLNKEREPVVEFESASFRPPLRKAPHSRVRSAFTYQQLSRLMMMQTNGITVVTGTLAAGISQVASDLDDYRGSDSAPAVMTRQSDRQSFGHALQEALQDRPKDQVSVFVVPDSVPWTDLWVKEAQARLKPLRSDSKIASVVFVAEPATLWRLIRDAGADDMPWMSLTRWNEGFLQHWLEDSRHPLELEDRRTLAVTSGLWPALIAEQMGDLTELRAVTERIGAAKARWDNDPAYAAGLRVPFGLDVAEPVRVLDVLARLGEPVPVADLALVAEASEEHAERSLRWAELLGLAQREGAGYWTVDPIISRILLSDGL